MARYYEEAALIEFVKKNTPTINGKTTMNCVERAIREAPTADVVPRVELDAMRGAANSYKMHYENAKREADRLAVELEALWVMYAISLALIFIIYKLMGLYSTDTDETVEKIFHDIDGAIFRFFIENYYDYQLDHSIYEIKKKYLPGGDRNEGEG